MKTKIIVSVLLISFIVLLTGCGKKEADFKLQIRESSWSGSSENYKPEEVTNEFDVVKGKEYKTDSNKFVFNIKKINKDSIVIETKEVYSDEENGVDLNTKKKEFKVFFDKETKLVTPTTGAGDIYYLKLVK